MTTVNPRADRLVGLWFGILGPPVFWAIRLSASYVMVPFACRAVGVLPLHLLAAGALVGTLAAGAVAYRAWTKERDGMAGDPGRDRTRFMAMIGVLSAAFFFAVIAAEALANFIFDPCASAGALL